MVAMSALKEYFRQLHHKRSIRVLTTIAVMVGLPFIGPYGYFFGVRNLKKDCIRFPLSHKFPKLKGLKIAQLSDLHFGPTNQSVDFLNRAIDMVLHENPDIIFLTGDYYQWDPDYQELLPRILSRLRAPLGVYGVFGNHDYGACYPGTPYCDPFDHNTMKSKFGDEHLLMLTNDAFTLEYNHQEFNLVGLHDLWSGYFDPTEAFQHVNQELPTLLLSHNPDTALLVKQDYDLMFSGHVHGGQVSLPFIGPVAVPVKNRHLRRGLHQITSRKHVYVNRGLGYTFRMRLNSRPEITIVEII